MLDEKPTFKMISELESGDVVVDGGLGADITYLGKRVVGRERDYEADMHSVPFLDEWYVRYEVTFWGPFGYVKMMLPEDVFVKVRA